jgi:D-glycero-D-manno-heptose 1,7-bisphosphate phosphatase
MDRRDPFSLDEVMTIPSVNNARLNANLNASMASAQRRGAVFLDRDQTLTIDHGYTHLVNDFAWMPGAPDALALFHRHGIACFIVTNQGGIGRGFYTVAQMQAFNDHLVTQAELAGGHIQDIAHCPHHPKAPTHAMKTPCACRKPAPGMLLGLATKWPIALTESVMIGDRDSDVAAGRAAGCHAYLFDGTDLSALAQQVIDRHFADNLGSDPQRGDHQGGSNRGGSNRGGDHA